MFRVLLLLFYIDRITNEKQCVLTYKQKKENKLQYIIFQLFKYFFCK